MEYLPYLSLILALLFAAGGVVFGRKLGNGEASRFSEQLEQLQGELDNLQIRYETLEGHYESAGRQKQQAEVDQVRLQEKLDMLQKLYQKSQQQLAEAESRTTLQYQDLSNLKADLAQEKEARLQEKNNHDEKIRLLESNRQQLTQEFENLSNKIFSEKQKLLVEQNKELQQQSRQGLDSLLNPFREQLDGLRKKVDDVYVSESKDRAALKAQIGELHQLNKQITEEASALSKALRGDKKTQGNWGELVLETVLERSGLRAGEEFVREMSLQDDEGHKYRPDVIINLPENKHIIVDAKVSLNAYTDYVNAETDAEREQYLKLHTEAIRNHIRGLSDKAYQKLETLNSPDFVFMFMPVEPAFMLAFQHDEKLFNDAFEQRIVVVTPTTLLATLRTVANLWSVERRSRSTEKLAAQAGKVYDRLRIVVEKMEKLGSQMGTAQKTYDEAISSLAYGRGNLVKTADEFVKLGVRVKKEIARNTLEKAREDQAVAELLEKSVPEQDAVVPSDISKVKRTSETHDLFAETGAESGVES